jgi:hypothetical protein
LKGEAGSLDCALLVDAAVKIEAAARAERREAAAEILDGLESTAHRFATALRQRQLETGE